MKRENKWLNSPSNSCSQQHEETRFKLQLASTLKAQLDKQNSGSFLSPYSKQDVVIFMDLDPDNVVLHSR
jgi:hypothetical protein